MRKDVELLATLFSEASERASASLRVVLNVAWFFQALYLPTIFLIASATLISCSETAVDILQNSVAAAFLLDMDSVLFQACLAASQRRQYKRMTRPPDNVAAWKPRALLCGSILLVVYTWCQEKFIVAPQLAKTWKVKVNEKNSPSLVYVLRCLPYFVSYTVRTGVLTSSSISSWQERIKCIGAACWRGGLFVTLGTTFYFLVPHAFLGPAFYYDMYGCLSSRRVLH